SQLSEVLGWKVQGWQMAVALESARETSGDFYDVLPLSGGKFGILIADVADKGLGSALYMAVSRTLIRTYAGQYEDDPSSVFAAANPRIMKDTHADLFVTVFYAVLDPETGLLTYCNAGHNPPYLISARSGFHVQALRRTGIPLGIFEGESWVHRTLDIKPGQMLVLYTDGVIDAQDEDGDFFGEDRFLEILEARVECTAQDVQDAVMTAIRDFSGGAVQADDITLMVLKRDP
ncbi:MAG: serine/threonine-protein phosphatase, partial [Anaerolineae bacterium]|nr:serine/threonine-protein phosphatase [Anaerolineae bacterium]